jgi:hypothetical protein
MVAGASVLLGGMDVAEVVVTVVIATATMVLEVALVSLAPAMVSAGRQDSLLVEVEGTPLVISPPSLRTNRVARPRIETMGRGNSSQQSSDQTSGSSIEVQIPAIFITMEVTSSTALGIMRTISMQIIVMGTMAVDPTIISIVIVNEEIMIHGFKMVQIWLVLILSCLKKLCRGLLQHWRKQLREEGLKGLHRRLWVLWYQQEHKWMFLRCNNLKH